MPWISPVWHWSAPNCGHRSAHTRPISWPKWSKPTATSAPSLLATSCCAVFLSRSARAGRNPAVARLPCASAPCSAGMSTPWEKIWSLSRWNDPPSCDALHLRADQPHSKQQPIKGSGSKCGDSRLGCPAGPARRLSWTQSPNRPRQTMENPLLLFTFEAFNQQARVIGDDSVHPPTSKTLHRFVFINRPHNRFPVSCLDLIQQSVSDQLPLHNNVFHLEFSPTTQFRPVFANYSERNRGVRGTESSQHFRQK